MTTCSICLNDIKDKGPRRLMTLSCDHVFHHSCFLSHAFYSCGSIFVSCPLCRQMNTKHGDFGSDKNNLLSLIKEPGKRCCHETKTKKGLRCKNKSIPFNYGYCKTHHKDTLAEDRYPLYNDYMKYLLESTNNWKTKIFMMDLAKQLLIKNDHIVKVTDIHHAFLEFFHMSMREDCPHTAQNPRDIYQYHGLVFPPDEWYEKSVKKEII